MAESMKQDTTIVIKSVDELIPYANNPRSNDAAVDAVAASIAEFGFKVPIVVDKDNVIVAGHTRLKAAKKLNLKKVPCIVASDLTPAQIKEYRLADNRVGELADWDMDLLKLEMEDIDIDMSPFGFDEEFLETDYSADDDEGKAHNDEFDIDAALEAKAFVKPGDVWKLGRHRLLCGDSTKPDDVQRLMDGKRADVCITDPPYNASYKGGTGMTLQNDSWSDSEKFYQFLLDACKNIYASLTDGGCCYIFHSDAEKVNFFNAAVNSGFHYSTTCVWVKNALVLGRMDYQMRHEPVLYCFKDTAKHNFYGDRTQTTVWEFDKPTQSKLHPTMKPLPLIAYTMRMSSKTGDLVLDLFGGSGTTLITAEQLDRTCFTMELDPKYASAIVRRYVALHKGADGITCIRDGHEIPCTEIFQPTEEDLSYTDADVTEEEPSAADIPDFES